MWVCAVFLEVLALRFARTLPRPRRVLGNHARRACALWLDTSLSLLPLCLWTSFHFCRDHGISSVGLPSRLAAFNSLAQSSNTHKNAWWHRPPTTSSSSSSSEVVELRNVQPGRRGLADRAVAVMQLPSVAAAGFMGPRMRLSLPSFRCVCWGEGGERLIYSGSGIW
jgi:hypothetical protein